MKNLNRNKKVVFIADDDEDDRLFLTEALLNVDANIEIAEAKNGAELLNLLKEAKCEPALIVLDMNMPQMNGLETLEALQSLDQQIVAAPTIMLSTSSDKGFAKKVLDSGIKDYFVKPYSVQGFLKLAQTLKLKYLT